MPKIRRTNIPPAVLNHLLDRIRVREVTGAHLGLLADWLDTEPEVPAGSDSNVSLESLCAVKVN